MKTRLLDLNGVSTPQLEEIRKVLSTGVPASADTDTPRNEVENMEDKERIASLEQENKDLKSEKETWSTEKSALEIAALKEEKETWTTEKAALEEKASQLETMTQELKDQKEELETLRTFKTDTDEAAEKAEKIKGIKTKLDEAEIEANLDVDADYWLSMTEDTLEKTIAKMKELKKGSQASASITVPPVISGDESNAKQIVADGLKERKQERDKR